ncbi:MAG: helix-turn-helix domain-containing protein [Candidatus Bathyarchaeota archaeon]|nr:helix-turn-helix domain-containing protein [Candidatus Bathyarchaeota archaeon]
MKAIKTIKDPAAFQLLADETRRKIVHILRAKEMTAGKIAIELKLTPQTVYHHIKKLLKGELIEVAREERCGHLIESYYRASAEMFSFSHGKATTNSLRSKQLTEDQTTTALKALKKIGFNLEYDEDKISQLVNAQSSLKECCEDAEKLEQAIYEMNDLDPLTKKTAVGFAKTITMSEEEFNKEQEKRRKFRQLLGALIKKQ